MSSAAVLIIDDEETLRSLLARIIELEGYTVYQAPSAKTAMDMLQKNTIHVVVSDVKLPDANGVELTQTIKTKFPLVEVIVLTAFGTIEDGVRAIKNGAFDYLTKGDHKNKIVPLLSKAAAKALLQQKVSALEEKLTEKFGFHHVLGSSPAIRQAVSLGTKVAAADTTVLLTGQTGTGKEIFAKAIHFESRRRSKPLVTVNCSTLGKDILESELFGHKAGAFTGANRDKKGLFEEAHEGTLFLDEIGEMSIDLQAKLLRVLETGTFIKVGETKETVVDVRLIAATNRDLPQSIQAGHFREDLFYRLSTFQIHLPALAERREDIPALAKYFISLSAAKINPKITGMAPDFSRALGGHSWRGNVRELKNIIERAVLLADSGDLMPETLPLDFNLGHPTDESDSTLASAEKKHIQRILTYAHGNKTQAARLLDIGLTTLYQKIKDYDIR
jgi:two-component system NtrC family response regulator